MGKETVLKKEFQKKDVERLRNLMQGKYGEKTRSSVGFSKAEVFHAEGDIWEADGRKWTIKKGIKQDIKFVKKLMAKLPDSQHKPISIEVNQAQSFSCSNIIDNKQQCYPPEYYEEMYIKGSDNQQVDTISSKD